MAEIPEVLVRYARHEYVAKPLVEQEDEQEPTGMDRILNIIHSRRGYNFKGYKRNTLMRRVRGRMGPAAIHSLPEYATLLAADPTEIDVLFKDLLIGVTESFRDPEAWQQLKHEVIAGLVEGKKSGDTVPEAAFSASHKPLQLHPSGDPASGGQTRVSIVWFASGRGGQPRKTG